MAQLSIDFLLSVAIYSIFWCIIKSGPILQRYEPQPTSQMDHKLIHLGDFSAKIEHTILWQGNVGQEWIVKDNFMRVFSLQIIWNTVMKQVWPQDNILTQALAPISFQVRNCSIHSRMAANNCWTDQHLKSISFSPLTRFQNISVDWNIARGENQCWSYLGTHKCISLIALHRQPVDYKSTGTTESSVWTALNTP